MGLADEMHALAVSKTEERKAHDQQVIASYIEKIMKEVRWAADRGHFCCEMPLVDTFYYKEVVRQLKEQGFGIQEGGRRRTVHW